MADNIEKPNSLWWQPAVLLFSQVSTWIVMPIIVALVVGKKLDTYYGTTPIIFFTLAGFGFLFTSVGIVRVVKKYINKLKEIENKNGDK